MTALPDLPDELISLVLSVLALDTDHKGRLSPHASGHESIVGFALTCRRAFDLSAEFLFKAIVLSTGENVKVVRDFYTFREDSPEYFNTQRSRNLRDLVIIPRSDASVELLEVPSVLADMPSGQLARLHLELPEDQDPRLDLPDFWDRLRAAFAEHAADQLRPLFQLPWASHLEHCHLNFQQNDNHPSIMKGLISVFAAPRLKSLVLVSIDFSSLERPKELLERSSTVESLSLTSCRVLPESFKILLSMPRALKHFQYSRESWSYMGQGDGGLQTRWLSLFGMCKYLGQQANFLTKLEFYVGGLVAVEEYETPDLVFRLDHLTSLNDITIRVRSHDQHEGPTKLLNRFPESLRRLSISEFPQMSTGVPPTNVAHDYLAEGSRTERQRRELLPNLQQLTLSLNTSRAGGASFADFRTELVALGLQYREHLGCRFIVNRITTPRHAYPPYLWHEHVPSYLKVYDNMIDDNLWHSKTDDEIQQEELQRQHEEWLRDVGAARVKQQQQLNLASALAQTEADSEDIIASQPAATEPVIRHVSQFSVSAAPVDNLTVIAAQRAMANAASSGP